MFGFKKKAKPATVPITEWLPNDVNRLRERVNKLETEVVAHREALRQIRDVLVKALEKPGADGPFGLTLS